MFAMNNNDNRICRPSAKNATLFRVTPLVAIIPPTTFIYPKLGLDVAPSFSKVVAGGIIGPIPYSALSIKALFGCTCSITTCADESHIRCAKDVDNVHGRTILSSKIRKLQKQNPRTGSLFVEPHAEIRPCVIGCAPVSIPCF